ncbi:uncharacterized protein [Asterias amurensis]|uniref:uncharacterized protein n=1 Tax=Asterias amurensis TaxID=7602 RepID=UPI003AB2D733
MFKFVNKRGELVPSYSTSQDATLRGPVTDRARPKDRTDNCTVCKTRRRSLDRQKAQVLRRSQSRETLQSSSTDTSEQSQPDTTNEMATPGAWSAKADKYRRLSRSCEVLSSRKKTSHRQSDDKEGNTMSHSKEMYENGAMNPAGYIDLCNVNPSKMDRLKMEEKQSLRRKSTTTKKFTPQSDCKMRHLEMSKGADYTYGECRRGNDRLSRSSGSMPERGASSSSSSSSSSSGKQVQFAARVEYERSKEDSVIGKLRNAVNNSRRKLRSRSLERIDRRQEWSREWEAGRAERASWMSRLRKSKSNTSSVKNDDILRSDETDRNLVTETLQDGNLNRQLNTHCVERTSRSRSKENRDWRQDYYETKPHENQMHSCDENNRNLVSSQASDKEILVRETLQDGNNRQLNTHFNERRSRSRSGENRDWRQDYCITKPHENKMYSCDDNNQKLVSSQAPDEEIFNRTREISSGDYKQRATKDNAPTYERHEEMRYNGQNTTGAKTNRSTRHHRSQIEQESNGLISPQYVAPHGHYGKAVVRKCHGEQRQPTDLTNTSKNVKVKSLSLASSTREDSVASSAKNLYQPKGTAGRGSVTNLDKCGMSAKKMAKLDSPLQSNAHNVSPDVPNALNIPNKHSMDAKRVSNCSVPGNIEAKPANVSRDKLDGSGNVNVTQNRSPNSSGFVYNCTTAKITKLGKSSTHKQQNLKQEKPQEQSIPQLTSSVTQRNRTDNLNLQDLSQNDTRKNKPAANNLTRHASVVSLSLISVNSVDSGTSCQEGSTADSSDRELEAYAYLQKPKSNTRSRQHGTETRYTTNRQPGHETRQSSKELENLILGSCFGVDKHGSSLVTSDYESDTGPDTVRSSLVEDTKRKKGGASRVVRFVGAEDLTKELHNKNQQLRIQGPKALNQPAAATKHSNQSTSSNHVLTKLTTPASVLHNHNALSKAEMSVYRGDVVYLSRDDFEQRPPWVIAYSSSSKQVGLVPSMYLATGKMEEGPINLHNSHDYKETTLH